MKTLLTLQWFAILGACVCVSFFATRPVTCNCKNQIIKVELTEKDSTVTINQILK